MKLLSEWDETFYALLFKSCMIEAVPSISLGLLLCSSSFYYYLLLIFLLFFPETSLLCLGDNMMLKLLSEWDETLYALLLEIFMVKVVP